MRKSLTSELDGIQGIGPGRRKLLLRRFGSLEQLKQAPPEELKEVLGPVLGGRVFDQLAGRSENAEG